MLSWFNHASGATICRCSQPMTGLFRNRCPADEKLINAYVLLPCLSIINTVEESTPQILAVWSRFTLLIAARSWMHTQTVQRVRARKIPNTINLVYWSFWALITSTQWGMPSSALWTKRIDCSLGIHSSSCIIYAPTLDPRVMSGGFRV